MFRESVTREMMEMAESQLGETEEAREIGLKNIREWVAQQSFSNQCPGDLVLLNFLRGCKFDQSKTREKLTHYFTTRTHVREVFQNRDPGSAELEEIISRGILTLIISEDVEALIVRWESCDVKKVSLMNVLKIGFMLFDIFINESHTFMILGHTIIIDCQNLPFGYVKQFFPTLIKDIAYVMFKAYPTRIKAVHVVNCCSIMAVMFNMFKPFLPVKMLSRIRFYTHNNIGDLQTYVHSSVLPKEYGGRGDSIHTLKEMTRRLLLDRRRWFLDENSRMIIDKALRARDVCV